MEYYKLMLVDDEEEVRTAIIKQLEWNKLGFEVVCDAENGEDALEKVDIYEPDVIMTDIRMPYMDGISLAKKVHSKYPNIKFIIFSGFDEFEYAKEAITLGVSEYILKPVNGEELSEKFLKIKKKLDLEIEEKRNIDKLRQNYIDNLSLLKNQFLTGIINNKFSDLEIKLRFKEYNIDLENALAYQVACVDIEYDNMFVDSKLGLQKELLSLSAINFINEKLQEYFRCSVFNSLMDDRILIIIAIDEKNQKISLNNIFIAICKEIKKIFGFDISIGIGSESKDIHNLKKVYHLAVEALSYKQIVGTGNPIFIKDVEPKTVLSLYLEKNEEEQLIQAIKFGPEKRIYDFIEKTKDRLLSGKVHLRQQQAYAFNIISILLKIMQQYEINFDDFELISKGYLYISEKANDIKEFIVWLEDICFKLNKIMRETREKVSKDVIIQSKEYINENYQSPDLSVDLICKNLHMSTAYFSTLFKREVGKTCIAYITDLRLNRAIELLNTTDYKTYKIADMVGYTEQNYFSYVFKKKYGVSPSKYRNR